MIDDTDLGRLAMAPSDELAVPDADATVTLDLQLIPKEEREGPDVPRASWQNLNPLFNTLADAQGVPVGSWDWMLGGMAAWSGSSGSQSSYGWNHGHKLSPHYIRSVLANYGHRRAFYLNAPFRQFHYAAASRPHGWTPESPGDQPDGTTIYPNGTRVSGPDAEHLWLTPLFALVDDPAPIQVETGLGMTMLSSEVARAMVTMLVSAAVGMVRDRNGDGTQPYPWTYGDRATSRLLHTIVEAAKRGCILPEDVPTAAAFIDGVVLPFYEEAPGIHAFGAAPPGRFPMGLFNGWGWIVPAAHDAFRLFSAKPSTEPWALRFQRLLERWSQWAEDMNEVLPVEWAGASTLFLDNAFVPGTNGEPAERILSFLGRDDFVFSFDFFPWTFRAVDICAQWSENAGLEAARDNIAARYAGNVGKRQWMVGEGGGYVEP